MDVFNNFITKYDLCDTYKHTKSRDFDKLGFIFCARRITSSPSRIYYILASDNYINIASNMNVGIGLYVEISWDHDYLQLEQ